MDRKEKEIIAACFLEVAERLDLGLRPSLDTDEDGQDRRYLVGRIAESLRAQAQALMVLGHAEIAGVIDSLVPLLK